MKKSAFVAALLLCVACAPGSFNGTVAGNGLDVQDVVFIPMKDTGGAIKGVMVGMSDVFDICTLMKANKEPKNATTVTFSVMTLNADYTFATPAAGDYPIRTTVPASGNYAGGGFAKLDSTCTDTIADPQGTAQSGTVKVSSITLEAGGTMSGTFDVTFGTSDTATGSFAAAYCDAPLDSGTTPTCE